MTYIERQKDKINDICMWKVLLRINTGKDPYKDPTKKGITMPFL